ncbi:hypothetical protein Q4595_16320 [Wenyingzhuangia sp. 1_MG-2023]|nr:hypothetical protein [Wenyingzhuangia sp. 1_MG-2023]
MSKIKFSNSESYEYSETDSNPELISKIYKTISGCSVEEAKNALKGALRNLDANQVFKY